MKTVFLEAGFIWYTETQITEDFEEDGNALNNQSAAFSISLIDLSHTK